MQAFAARTILHIEAYLQALKDNPMIHSSFQTIPSAKRFNRPMSMESSIFHLKQIYYAGQEGSLYFQYARSLDSEDLNPISLFEVLSNRKDVIFHIYYGNQNIFIYINQRIIKINYNNQFLSPTESPIHVSSF